MLMANSPNPIDPELLLRESAWLHALARSLVGDSNAADDVVQETWLAALKRPPRSGEQGQVRAFLRTVVRRIAGSSARDEAGRRRRERAASRDEAVAPESEGLERLALQRQIAEAVLTLREPYRSAVVMRYVQGLAPREIAAQLDVSPEAARTRISRGLDLLRERLDREHGGDRSAWSAAIGGLVHGGSHAGGIAGISGGIVGSKMIGTAAAAVLALVVLTVTLRAPNRIRLDTNGDKLVEHLDGVDAPAGPEKLAPPDVPTAHVDAPRNPTAATASSPAANQPDPGLAPDGKPWSSTMSFGDDNKESYAVKWTGPTKRVFYPSGELYAEMTYLDGKQEGPSHSWYRNGQPWSEDHWIAGKRTGPSTALSDTGVLLARGDYKAGYRDGHWEEYFRTGEPREVGNYESSPSEWTQLKVGYWTVWKAPGVIDDKETGTYVHGKLVPR